MAPGRPGPAGPPPPSARPARSWPLPQIRPALPFDFDGVLVDGERVHLAVIRQAFPPEAIDIDERTSWQRYLDSDDFGAATHVLRDAGRVSTPDLAARFVDPKAATYLQPARSSLRVFDGAARLSGRARRGLC